MSAPNPAGENVVNLIREFVSDVQKVHVTGNATEHSYRSAFESLFSGLGVTALNEPKRVKCGAPDFMISRDEFVIGHVEAKDLHVSIRNMKGDNKSQQDRYRDALPNLIYTNALDWDFYRDGELIASVAIAVLSNGVLPRVDQYDALGNLLGNFIVQEPQTITSPGDLAERMAGKAKLIKDVLCNALTKDDTEESALAGQYQGFKENLIHDITEDEFADVYAETIAYGMFAARLHDRELDSFNRQEALELLPKSNPFLRSLFTYIASQELDERIVWIIDELASVFQACDVAKLMENFGKLTGQDDPFLQFYETFLAAYNPKKRKARGVWYTPEPVVNFIVRAVDEVLQNEFELPEGLSDTSKVSVEWDTGQTRKGKAVTVKKDVHRVQILDPATGTGTFLAETIKLIARQVHGVAPGMWSRYIENDLVPRLHGLELLMASYAMCHMKLDMILTELGYKPSDNPPRLSVFLTNSLEEGEPANKTLQFAQWISREAKGANTIKRDMPIMCVIGNPPYSGISDNKGKWISELIEDYKYVDGEHFGEKKHWLQDDYVKFIRMSSHLIEKNGEGVLGFITNHGYLDNPTFRGMRWHLLRTFDRIFVLDLHGNANKKEVTPDGKPDKNVFDIRQGVAIIIAMKTGAKDGKLAEVSHGDLWGTREAKYETLLASQIRYPVTKPIDCIAPLYAFVPRNYASAKIYGEGFGLAEFMPANITGIVTAKDNLVTDFTKAELESKIRRFLNPKKTDEEVRTEFFSSKKAGKYPPGDSRGWKLPTARVALQATDWVSDIQEFAYRPFDTRVVLYRPDMVDWGRFKIMPHLLRGRNVALVFSRQAVRAGAPPVNVMATGDIFDARGVYSNKGISQAAPLYLYPAEQDLDRKRRVNFDRKLWGKLKKSAQHHEHGIPDELAIFDYIYGVLHCPSYRETYAEFLKADFPRIPWPVSPDEFWDVSWKGTELRKLHVMEPQAIGETPFPFFGDGENVVDNPVFKDGKVWINKTQYFDTVPEVSWDLYIGGYQPAQKWLKDRKSRELEYEDVKHYQRILKILAETDRIMGTIRMKLTSKLDSDRDPA